MDEIKLRNHFTFLVYPFLHSLTSKSGVVCTNEMQMSWKLRWSRLWEIEIANNKEKEKVGSEKKGGQPENIISAIDDTFFFLPYIRSLIFPETTLLKGADPGENFAKWADDIRSWDGEIRRDFHAFRSKMNPDALLWLRLNAERSNAIKDFTVVYHCERDAVTIEHQEIAAKLGYVEAMLFPTGLGFLIFKVKLADRSSSFSQLIDLNYHLRLVHGPTVKWILPSLKIVCIGSDNKPDTKEHSISVRDLMDFLLQGMVSDSRKIEADLAEFIAYLQSEHRSLRYTETDAGQVYGERCHLLSYACIDAKQADSRAGAFDTVEDRLLYEFATCTPLGDSIGASNSAPSPDEAKRMMNHNRVFVWNCWRGIALKDNIALLATEDIHFNKVGLPHNIENDYLPLYLYALYQKYQLFVFAEEMVRKVADIQANLREVRRLADRFVSFRNKYWFNEITRNPLGNELYRKFHAGLATESLYDLVSNEVSQIKEHYESKNDKSISALLNFLTFVFLPLGAVIGAFGMNFVDGSWKRFGITFALVASVSFILWLVWNSWRRK